MPGGTLAEFGSGEVRFLVNCLDDSLEAFEEGFGADEGGFKVHR